MLTYLRDPEFRAKLLLMLVILAVLGFAHAGLVSWSNKRVTPFSPLTVFDAGVVSLHIQPTRNVGVAFGLSAASTGFRLIRSAIGLSISLTLAACLLLLADRRFRLQTFFLLLLGASALALAVEEVCVGSASKYFAVRFFGPDDHPIGSLFDWGVALGVLYLYGVAALRFFRKPRTSDDAQGADVRLMDPLYRHHRPLRVLMWLFLAAVLLQVLALGAQVIPKVAEEVRLEAFLLAVALALGMNSPFLLILLYILRAIPRRPVDVLVLRAHLADWRTLRLLRLLRKQLRPLRVTGAYNPRESRRLIHLPLWLFLPFVFAIGDHEQTNMFGHSVHLGRHWQGSIRQLLRTVRAAIFDCRILTENVVWEIEEALRALGPDHCFFIAWEHTAQQLRQQFAERYPGLVFAGEDELRALGMRIRELEASPAA